MFKAIKHHWHKVLECLESETGATAIEYALIGSVISVIAVTSITTIGTTVNQFFTNYVAAYIR